jgi:hypothetical protein
MQKTTQDLVNLCESVSQIISKYRLAVIQSNNSTVMINNKTSINRASIREGFVDLNNNFVQIKQKEYVDYKLHIFFN